MCKRVNIFIFFVPVLVSIAFPAYADIVKYVDEGGTIHFTNRPMNNSFSIYLKVPREKAKKYLPARSQLYEKEISTAGKTHGIDPKLIKSVIQVESAFNRKAISPAGAQGLMQLMPKTARKYKVRDAFIPSENINAGTNYLSDLLEIYKGDLRLALAAYNAGETAVKRFSGIPPYPETINYVKKVMAIYDGAPVIRKKRKKKMKIYRYIDSYGNILLTDTPRGAISNL